MDLRGQEGNRMRLLLFLEYMVNGFPSQVRRQGWKSLWKRRNLVSGFLSVVASRRLDLLPVTLTKQRESQQKDVPITSLAWAVFSF